MRAAGLVLSEAFRSALSQKVASAAVVLMVGGMCAAVALTAGKSAGATRAVLSSLDSVGARSIVVRADPEAGIDSEVVGRLSAVEGISWSAAFGPAIDVHNVVVPGGERVSLRTMWTQDAGAIGIDPNRYAGPDAAWATPDALTHVGIDRAGGVESDTGTTYGVVGTVSDTSVLQPILPALVVPATPSTGTEPVAVVIVVVERPTDVAAVARAVAPLLDPQDPTKVTITTSESVATLRSTLQGDLSRYGASLTSGVVGVTASLVCGVLFGTVILRRRDFGRRRALGASQELIVSLLVVQTSLLALIGSCCGCAVATIVLRLHADPAPSPSFYAALVALAVALAIVAASLPAVFAARRDPLHELRVP